MELPTVVNVKDIGGIKGRRQGDVYIGRPQRLWESEGFGNPFKITARQTREQVIVRYAEYLEEHSHLVDKLIEMKPKRLLCWCAPFDCHGDVLVKAMKDRIKE